MQASFAWYSDSRETGAYTLKPCSIYFTDGPGGREDDGPTAGKTFMYAGDAVALKEGRFDRLLWELQMGTRLPPEWCRGVPEAGGE